MIVELRRRCRFILAIAAPLVFASCGTVQYASHYLLDIAPTPAKPAASTGALGPLGVRELECPPYLCEGRVVYREQPYRLGFYDHHRWAVDPRTALSRLLADRIRASSLFENVTVGASPEREPYLLRGEIERFEEVDEKTSVSAICSISARIVDAKTGNTIWTGTAAEAVPVQQRDVAGVVAGLATASTTVADRLVASMADLPAHVR